MEQLKTTIQKIVSQKSIIDWMIVHEISKKNVEIDGITFSFVDGKENLGEPFKTNQGYISLTPSTITEFIKILNELSDEFKTNTIALANLFIIITRTSYYGEEEKVLIEKFKRKIREDSCNELFDLLIDSLNTEYYKDTYFSKNPKNTNEWLELLNSTKHVFSISDPLINCLQLVRNERNRKIDFELLENMKPSLRAVLLGQYGFDLGFVRN